MANLRTQKRLAADILKVGLGRVKFNPNRIDEIKEAITRKDIEELIKDKAIVKRPVKGRKRRAGKIRQLRRKKGLGKGQGKIKRYIVNRKRNYIILIRNLRRYLYSLKNRGILNAGEHKKLRKLAKAGIFKDKKSLTEYLRLKMAKKL